MADFEANFTLEQQPTIEADFSMTVINTDHDALTNRDMADQHPISAITGLQDALDSITSDMVTEQELSDALATKQDTLTAGTGISIENGVISSTQTSAEWGNIGGTLSDQTDLNNALNNLSGGIDNNHQAISSINQTISAYGNIVTHNTSEFATATQGTLADTAIQPNDNISELNNNVGYITGITSSDVATALGYTPYNSSNPSNYQTATQVANSIATETTNRESADNNLQSQIDAIVSSSDVFDIVGTYAELQAYDITTVPVNDIIKVLVDSTHNNAATYYRCVETGGVKSWSYIGSEGAYYTKAEADAAFVPQTRTINNKALSANISLTAADVGALPSSTVIPTVNNPTITFTQGGVNKGSFTLNQSSNQTIALDAAGSTPANMVTTNTDQDITGVKTFVGEKRIKFKQSASGNKLGFTLYDNNNKEAATFEYRPATINSYPLLSLGQFKGSGTSYISTPIYLGFRCYDSYNHASYNLVAPLAKDARSSFSLDVNYKTFYLPLGVTDGNTTVTTASTGLLDISSLLQGLYTAGTGIDITSNTISVDSTIASGAAAGATAVQPSSLATVATSGDYDDLSNKPTTPTVDQTYSASSTNAQSGVAISEAKFLQNTATNTESLTIYGDASNRRNTINIGAHSSPTGVNSVMIGAYSQAGEGAFAIGNGATAGNYSLGLLGSATANYAYQIGRGTNTEANSLYVGWASTGNYKLLGSDGLIPTERLNVVTSVSASSTDTQIPSAKLFYDTCGDIETLINAL